ncbi:LysE family translocator [Streptomyces sp. NPDC005438]|uniref:LysE family translocator n=1 Tax=Streptomyces sp. NPDC005438 TaxID=3156880 RepID=UPI00339E661F
MPSLHVLGGFLLAVLPLVATPGASLALLTGNVAVRGPGAAPPVIGGTVTGLYVHALLAATGLSALVTGSEGAFTVVRLVGAGYLVALGLWTWLTLGTHRGTGSPDDGPTAAPVGAVTARPLYVQALWGSLLNPKAAAIHLTLAPQFVRPDQPLTGQLVALATVQALLVTGWLGLWALLLGRTGHLLAGPRARLLLGRITALTLVALGVGSAVG